MNIDHKSVVILGAGIAGLGAAQKAKHMNLSYKVYEKGEEAGGLLNNFQIGDFRFDNAVHLSFAEEKLVRDVFDQTPYITHPSDSYCRENDLWLKHPVQNNLYPLQTEEKINLINSFVNRPGNFNGADNYDLWLRAQYGDLIAERFPIRYTKKYWDSEACELSTSWIGNRMRRAELSEILYGAFSPETPNHYYTKEMRYPKKGGFKSFIQPLISTTDISYQHECVCIDFKNKYVKFSNGNICKYDRLVNTLPLPKLVSLIKEVPENLFELSKSLKATSIDLVSFGFGRVINSHLWFYIYDDDIYASRAYSPSVKSSDNAPPGCSSIQFEIYSRGENSRYEKADLIDNTLKALRKISLADQRDILFVDHRRIPYGNVIFDHDMEIKRDNILDWCRSVGINSCGRFGAWDYYWSNQSFISGYNSLI